MPFAALESWTNRPEPGIRNYSGKAVYRKTFDAPRPDQPGKRWLDLGDVQDVGVARIRLNGRDLGIVWCPPFRVPLGNVLKPTGNKLEIEVINSWRNRLIGDRDKPQLQRLTQTNITIKPNWQLLPAGLLGPVTLLSATDPTTAR